MRIIVTGSREYEDRDHLFACLDLHLAVCVDKNDVLTIVHGGARGADSLAHEWVWSKRATYYATVHAPEVHPADWGTFGKKAGPMRNIKMAALGADRCIAFYQDGAANRGTQHMVNTAIKHNIPVEIHGGQ